MIGIGTQEIIFIVLIVLLFWGGKKIPELMKGLGRGVRSFRDGMNGVDDKNETASDSAKKEEKEHDTHDETR